MLKAVGLVKKGKIATTSKVNATDAPAFGTQYFSITRDISTCAKTINNAAVPMGAVLARTEIHDAIAGAAPAGQIEFLHG